MSSKPSFLKRVWNFLIPRIYTNDIVILFEHRYITDIFSSVIVKHATKENISDVLSFQAESYLTPFNAFLDAGDQGYLAYLKSKCAHRSWVKSGKQKIRLHPFLSIKLNENEAFIHWCETANWARGQNIFPFVLNKIVNENCHKNKILMCVNKKNTPSIKSTEKAGFVPIAEYHILLILGIKFVRKNGAHFIN